MNVLALDLGTDTGWATNAPEFRCGTWKLATTKEIRDWGRQRMTRRRDWRTARMKGFVEATIPAPDLIIFEDVQFASSTLQVQLWASLRTAVWLSFLNYPRMIFECVNVSKLKKFATGHGNATKEMMEAALFRKYPELKNKVVGDDAVDAVWLLKWAEAHIKL